MENEEATLMVAHFFPSEKDQEQILPLLKPHLPMAPCLLRNILLRRGGLPEIMEVLQSDLREEKDLYKTWTKATKMVDPNEGSEGGSHSH